MMTLSEYLNESVELPKTGFSTEVAQEDIGKFFDGKFSEVKFPDYVKAIQDLANEIFTAADIDNPRILKCEGKGFLKIPYEVTTTLDLMTIPKPFTLIEKGNKRFIKIGNRRIFETGSGSDEHKLSPVIHENITCLYFNNRDDWGNIGNKNEIPTGFAYTLMIDLDISKLWVKSFIQQVIAIDSYLSSLGITPKSLRAVRIDSNVNNRNMVYNGIYDGNVPDKDLLELDKIALEKYNTIVKRFKPRRVKRETIDKSDILLYNPDEIENIDADSITIPELRELLSNGTLIGIALKQLKSMNGSFNVTAYNVDKDKSGKVDLKNRLKNYKILPFVTRDSKDKNIFNVKNQVDIQLDTFGGTEYIITYRSFGGIYMDIHKKNGTALGKVPVALYRESVDTAKIDKDFKNYFRRRFDEFNEKFGWGLDELGEKKLKFDNPKNTEILEKCIKLLTFLYEQDKQLHKLLQSWMSGALAEGDQKFPFLLTEPK